MRAISNAFLKQIDVTQLDRWDHGPLELAIVPEPTEGHLEFVGALFEWNSTQRGGFLRSGEALESLQKWVRFLEQRRNPNMIIVPQVGSTTALDHMLAGLLPDACLAKAGLTRIRTNLNLAFFASRTQQLDYGARARAAFSEHVWSLLAPSARLDCQAFSANSPMRLLAGDTRFWAHRIYRLALDRQDTYCQPVDEDEESWEPVEDLTRKMLEGIPLEDRPRFSIHRPLYGTVLWDIEDEDERAEVLAAAIDGDGVQESLAPVIDLLHRHRSHEDFSTRHSWIKEDFERSFYSKRARLKVDLVETLDDLPVYDVNADSPYEHVLFRDLLAFLDLRERRLTLALRQGRTASEIAADEGLRGHAAVSRRIHALKRKIARLLN
jgi:hypothetical protein